MIAITIIHCFNSKKCCLFQPETYNCLEVSSVTKWGSG